VVRRVGGRRQRRAAGHGRLLEASPRACVGMRAARRARESGEAKVE